MLFRSDESPAQRKLRMETRAKMLGDKREAERQEFVKAAYERQWRLACDPLREKESQQYQDEHKELLKNIKALKDAIKALEEGIVKLDKDVAEATENRKAENVAYKELMAADTAAEQLLSMAANRLAKFYTPKLYVAPPKQELSAEQRIAVNMGSEPAPTEPPMFVQIHQHSSASVAPPPPPETWGAYKKKGEEHGGVVAMINMLKADLEKEMQEATVEEKDSQSEYESMMADSAEKRTLDSKTLADKESSKADLEEKSLKLGEEKTATMKEVLATADTLKSLHLECDWLVSNFEVRKDARAGEVDALKKAKAVLSGADFSLVEVGRAHLRGSK